MAVKIKRALISVSNKIGLLKFSEVLQSLGVEIVSTGGTYKQLFEAGLKVMKVEELTNFPEMMNGRLKTLHPNVHGAILADRSKPEHLEQALQAGMKLIDMVVVNLYPFKETVSKESVTLQEAIENIDIGGPTMLRSAAKNHKSVAVVVDPEDYEKIADELVKNDGFLNDATLFALSVKAFQHTCEYDSVIFNWLSNRYSSLKETEYKDSGVFVRNYLKIDCTKAGNEFIGASGADSIKDAQGNFNKSINLKFEKIKDLRYGENPHQKAAYYRYVGAGDECLAASAQLQGKELSYNNILDTNAAFAIVKEFESPTVAIIKHNNPCGVSSATTVTQAYFNAHGADPLSAFGGVVACNYKWTTDAARFMSDKFVEVLIAPDFEPEALDILKSRENLRVLKIRFNLQEHLLAIKSPGYISGYPDLKGIDGGLLVQDLDEGLSGSEVLETVTVARPTRSQTDDMLFAWQIIKNVKSNAILLAKNKTTTGVGTGQMSRVDSARLATEKAGENAKGSVLASDAYFPFTDAVEIALKAGIAAIIQPGGSIHDKDVIELCNKYSIPMVFTGKRHFKH
jgi:phosphoribosylaminoimidazolecarboxamide formyltransferase / IMP cyclohydrolase